MSLIVHASPQNIEAALKTTHIEYCFVEDFAAIIEETHHKTPKAIIIEIQSDKNDLSLIEALTYEMPHIPILALTSPEWQAAALKAGATELLSIPLGPIELQQRLKTLSSRLITLTGSIDVLAHDFNNPISITAGSLELALEILQDEEVAPELSQLIKNVLLANYRLKFMVDDFVDFFRLQANQLAISLMPVVLQQVIQNAVRHIQGVAEQNNITIEVNLPEQLPKPRANDRLLERVILAALDTSIKFVQPNSTIVIEGAEADNGVSIAITDSGQAIKPPYHSDQLFDLTLITEVREKGCRSSVGLSLPFCRAAMQAMHGSIHFESNRTTDLTTLILWLPTKR